MGYNALTCGLIPNDPTKAQFNSNLLHQITNDATIGTYPDTIDFPPVKDAYYLQNGMNEIGNPGAVYRGFTGMGAGERTAPASRIVGIGRGHTLKVSYTGMGCIIEGLSIHSNYTQDQNGNYIRDQAGDDTLIWIEGTQTLISDVYLGNGLTSLRVERKLDYPGEFWFSNIEIEGDLGFAAGVYNAGDSTIDLDRVITNNTNPTQQPQYGHMVVCSGEFQMGKCDTINCGNCLALVPGMGLYGMPGGSDQYVKSAFISRSLFDSGKGEGCFLIKPQLGGFIASVNVQGGWASTPGNFNRTAKTNGVHIDGSLSTPKYMSAIKDISFEGFKNKSFKEQSGFFLRNATAVKIRGCTIGDHYDGIRIAKGCPGLMISNNHIGDFVPATEAPNAGNNNSGIYIEDAEGDEAEDPFLIDGNVFHSNGVGGWRSVVANRGLRPGQIITPNNLTY